MHYNKNIVLKPARKSSFVIIVYHPWVRVKNLLFWNYCNDEICYSLWVFPSYSLLKQRLLNENANYTIKLGIAFGCRPCIAVVKEWVRRWMGRYVNPSPPHQTPLPPHCHIDCSTTTATYCLHCNHIRWHWHSETPKSNMNHGTIR